MDGKRRRAPDHQSRYGEIQLEQPLAQSKRARQPRLRGSPPRVQVVVMDMPIVSVQAIHDEVRHAVDERVKFRSRVARGNSRATHSDFKINQDWNGLLEPARGRGKHPCRFRMIDGRTEDGVPIGPHKLDKTLHIRSDEWIRDKDVGTARRGNHLGLSNGGALVLMNAQRFHHPDYFSHFVRFNVRPQSCGAAGHGDHRLDVLTNQRRIDQKGRTEKFRRIADHIMRIDHGISTSVLRIPDVVSRLPFIGSDRESGRSARKKTPGSGDLLLGTLNVAETCMPNWQQIVEREGPAVWRTVYRIVGNRADGDEVFQEAFLAAWEVSRREQVHNWRAFLLRLATARAVDRLRQRHRRSAREQTADWEVVPGREPSPSQSALDAELSESLRLALAHFVPRQAEIFCLHCVEGWSYQEIAKHLQISVDSVDVLLHRARRHIPIDDALFRVEPRAGYSLRREESKAIGMDPKTFMNPEKAAAELLRILVDKSGGTFPKRLDDPAEMHKLRSPALTTVVQLVDHRYTQELGDLPPCVADPLPVGKAREIHASRIRFVDDQIQLVTVEFAV